MSKTLQLKVITALQDRLSGPLQKIRGAGGQSVQSMQQLREKLKSLEGTQKTVGAFRDLTRGVEQTKNSMHEAQARTDELARKLKSVEQPTAALRREFNQAVGASRKLKAEHQGQSEKLQALRSRLGDAGVSTKSLGSSERSLRQNITQTNQALEQQKNKLSQVAQQQRKLAEAKDKYSSTTATAANLAVTGAAGYSSGRRILGGAADFMSDGMDFDKTMSKVQALTRLEKGDDRLQMLRDQARELGATTQFTSTDAAAGQAFLGMAGFTPEAIKAAMPGVLSMALAGDMDIGTTADIGSNILTGMNLQADQMNRVADVVTGAFTRSNTSISTLGETMKYAAPGAAQFGVDLETVAAMAAKLGDAGIQGSMGGTGIRRIIGRLAAPNKAAREALEELGVQVSDSTGAMRPMDELLGELYKKSKDLTEIQRGTMWKDIAGETGANSLGVLVERAGDGSLQNLLGELRNNTLGEAAKNAATQTDNAMGDLRLLESAWSDVSIEVFSQNNAAIRELIQSVTSIVSGVGAWAQRNPELVATLVKVIAVVGALLVVFGGITVTIAGILGPFAMLRYGMTVFGIKGGAVSGVLAKLGRNILPMVGKAIMFMGRALLMNPIGLAIVAIAAAAFLIYKYWEPIKAFFTEIWAEVKAAFDGGIGSVAELIVNWSPLGLFYKAFAAVMDYLGIELPGKFTDFGSMMMSGLVNGIKNMGSAVKDSIVGVGESAVGWFKDKLGIESPSRVFIGLGANVSEGAALGISRSTSMATNAAAALAAGVLTAGTLAPLSVSAMPELTFDKRPALASFNPVRAGRDGGGAGSPSLSQSGDHIEFHIHAAPGMAAQDIAQAVAAELDKRDRARAARTRSSLSDYGR